MLSKLYIDNYRCFQNLELDVDDVSSLLLLGRNGAGKTNLFNALEIFQKIGRGDTLIKDLLDTEDFAYSDITRPVLFELHAVLGKKQYKYKLGIEMPVGFQAPRVKQEVLSVDAEPVYVRERGDTKLHDKKEFTLDWHHAGLPLIMTQRDDDPVAVFKHWLANITLLSPYPDNFDDVSKSEDEQLQRDGRNVLNWLRRQLAESPALYNDISDFLKARMPDFDVFKFETTGRNEKELLVDFRHQGKLLTLNYSQLSDGEKIYFLAAAVLASVASNKTMLCLWDEPDTFISLVELSHFIAACRKRFENTKTQSQLIITSHNARTINEFPNRNIRVVSRESHLHPSRIQHVEGKKYLSPNLVEAYENGELD